MERGQQRGEIILTIVLVLLVVFGWYNVYNLARSLEASAIQTFQAAQLEIVRNAGRGAKLYIENEIARRGEEAVPDIEVEVLNSFVLPIRIGSTQIGAESTNVGDAWIYAPDHVVFDPSEDFPAEYVGLSMAEIFELQQENGAYHYEDMSGAVGMAQGGTGWYVWDPAKAGEAAPLWEFLTRDSGIEVAAWWPIEPIEGQEAQFQWVIGMSAMLPHIMRMTGAYDQIQSAAIQMLVVTVAIFALLVALRRAQAQVQELREQVAELRIVIDEARKSAEVADIVDSEYFQQLESRAKELRQRKRESRE